MPPGSAKSTYGSVLFPPWLMQSVTTSVLAASHTTELAEKWGRRVRNLVNEHTNELGISVAPDNMAAGRWALTSGAEYYAAGVGTGIAGFRAGLGLIDDPIRSRQDADSELIRDRIWDWYINDFRTRLVPRHRIWRSVMKIAITREGGAVSIMTMIDGTDEKEELRKWSESSNEKIVSWAFVDGVPDDRTFRGAWKYDGGKIGHDMPRCRDIWRDKMRAARVPKLSALDIEFQRATEDVKDTSPIIDAKKRLRDVTKHPAIDSAKTPDELKAVWPDYLN